MTGIFIFVVGFFVVVLIGAAAAILGW